MPKPACRFIWCTLWEVETAKITSFFLRGGDFFFFERGCFSSRGVLLMCNVVFFDRGCFSSRGGTSDVQHDFF